MSGSLLEYSGLVTKTKAMSGRLLEKEDYVKAMELIPLGFQKGSPEYEKCHKVWHP